MKERRQDNETVHLMRWSNMRFKRRLDIPMWHIEHLKKSIADLEELTEELKRIYTSNRHRMRLYLSMLSFATCCQKIRAPEAQSF
jgi:hypothetical protein